MITKQVHPGMTGMVNQLMSGLDRSFPIHVKFNRP